MIRRSAMSTGIPVMMKVPPMLMRGMSQAVVARSRKKKKRKGRCGLARDR
jgi:hypothetical protein